MALKTDFVGTHAVDATIRDSALAAAGLEGQQMFNAMAQYGQTTSTPPLTLAQMVQTYIIPDLAAVDALLPVGGIRGHRFMEIISGESPGPIAVGTVTKTQSASGPNTPVIFRFDGAFPGGAVINVSLLVTDPDNESESLSDAVVLPPTPPGQEFHDAATAASVVSAAIDSVVHVRSSTVGPILTVTPAAPANTVNADITL